MNSTNIHNAQEIKEVYVSREEGGSGWISIEVRSVSPYTEDASTHEITFFARNIDEFAQDLYKKLGLELDKALRKGTIHA